MNKITWLSLISISFSMALDCPKRTSIELESAEESIYTTKVDDNLGVPIKKSLAGDLNDLTFLKSDDFLEYMVLSKIVATCDWAENTNEYLKSNADAFSLIDSVEYSIFRDTNRIELSSNSYLPLGEMDAHV